MAMILVASSFDAVSRWGFWNNLPSFVQDNKFVHKIYNSTVNGIDLEDFGDTYVRQFMYDVIWLLG